LSSTTQEKNKKTKKNDDEPRGSLSFFVNIKHPVGSSSMPTHTNKGVVLPFRCNSKTRSSGE
jgi:hypothetical protein